MTRKFLVFTLFGVFSLSWVLSYGTTNPEPAAANMIKTTTNDLVTNDVHITKIDDEGVTLVYEVPQKKKDIYNKLMAWIAVNYRDSKSVIQNSDPETGQIIGKGVTEIPYFIISIMAEYTIIIDIKDNKYRVQFNKYVFLGDGRARRNFEPGEKPSIDEVNKNLILQSRRMYDSVVNSKKDGDF